MFFKNIKCLLFILKNSDNLNLCANPCYGQVYAGNSKGHSDKLMIAESVWLREDTTKVWDPFFVE